MADTKKPISKETIEHLKILGNAFLQRRLQLGKFQNEIVEKSGVSQVTIMHMEKQKIENTSFDTLVKIANVLDMPLEVRVDFAAEKPTIIIEAKTQ